MPRYLCEFVDPSGTRVRTQRFAASRSALMDGLGRNGQFLLSAEEADSKLAFDGFQRGPASVLELVEPLTGLLRAGLSLPVALEEADGLVGRRAAPVLDDLLEAVTQGGTLTASMREHPQWFDSFIVGAIEVGERSGRLVEAFERVERKLTSDRDMRSELMSALMYPVLLTVAGAAAIGVLLTVVLPQFGEVLSDSGGTLPPLTAMVLGASSWLSIWWPVLGLGMVTLMLVALALPRGLRRRVAAQAFSELPFARDIRRQRLTAVYSRVVGSLLSAGAPLSDALDHAAEATSDPIARESAHRIAASVRDGESLVVALGNELVFDPILTRMVGTGEATGRLADFMERAAGLHERRLERITRRALSLAEPALILAIGSAVGLVAMAVVQAVYGLNAQTW